MSVLIKGMVMPKTCEACPFSGWSNLFQTSSCKFISVYDNIQPFDNFSREYLTTRSKHCPLVEVPTPHGDLIDIDTIDLTNIDDTSMAFNIGASWVIMQIARAKTVIESEK